MKMEKRRWTHFCTEDSLRAFARDNCTREGADRDVGGIRAWDGGEGDVDAMGMVADGYGVTSVAFEVQADGEVLGCLEEVVSWGGRVCDGVGHGGWVLID